MIALGQMRLAIDELAWNDPLVRRVFDLANIQGMSDSERYLTLAYYAMQQAQTLRSELLDHLRNEPVPTPIMVEAKNFSDAVRLRGNATLETDTFITNRFETVR